MNTQKLRFSRRALLGGFAGGLLAATLGDCADSTPTLQGKIGKDGKRVPPWNNWSGIQTCRPDARLLPRNESEVVSMLKRTTGKIRCVGAGHSWSPLVPTEGALLSLAWMHGVRKIDVRTKQVELAAGTRLFEIGEPLWKAGLGLLNMPDINTQEVAGSIATSTHGTGISLGSLSSAVTGIRLVSAGGEILNCSAKANSDLFQAARNHLGALGVLTSVKMQAREAYKLKEKLWVLKADEGLAQALELRDKNRHFEMLALPHSDYVLAISTNETSDAVPEAPPEPKEDGLEPFRIIANVLDWLPFLRSFILNTVGASIEPETRSERVYRLFGASKHDIRFNEMEYSVPADLGPKCMAEILAVIKKLDIDVIFPIQMRFVKGDDIWLSPFYQRDSCAISCHQFHDRDHAKYFAAVEPIFRKYDGRPHWGKMHSLKASDLAGLYPRYGDFLRVRRELDPAGRFMNGHLGEILGG